MGYQWWLPAHKTLTIKSLSFLVLVILLETETAKCNEKDKNKKRLTTSSKAIFPAFQRLACELQTYFRPSLLSLRGPEIRLQFAGQSAPGAAAGGRRAACNSEDGVPGTCGHEGSHLNCSCSNFPCYTTLLLNLLFYILLSRFHLSLLFSILLGLRRGLSSSEWQSCAVIT